MATTVTAKPQTEISGPGLRNIGQLGGQHDRKISTQSLCQDQVSWRDFVLAALRCTSLRVKLIDNEITAIGTALRAGFISPDTALAWAEETAPGCVGFIPEAVTADGVAV
jgi:hypothetical protein